MKPGDEGEREDGAAVAAVAVVIGDELAATDLPRSPFYPTAAELARLTRGVAAQLAGGWRLWLEQTFSLAREVRARAGAEMRSAPDARPRAELLAELEQRRPGTTRAAGLLAMLADDAILAALVDAVAMVDSVGATAVDGSRDPS